MCRPYLSANISHQREREKKREEREKESRRSAKRNYCRIESLGPKVHNCYLTRQKKKMYRDPRQEKKKRQKSIHDKKKIMRKT